MAEPPVVNATVLAGDEIKAHLIKIDGYSRTKELLEAGKFTTSIPFIVGGQDWVVKYYPNGCKSAAAYVPGYTSVYLVLDSADAKDVDAQFRFDLIDKDGVPVPSSCRISKHIFTRKGSAWGFAKFFKHEELEGSVHLPGDSIRIVCDVNVMMKIPSQETKSKRYVAVPRRNLGQHLRDLLESKDVADVTFQVGGEIFSAHRTVLAARSSVFKAELFGTMKEKTVSPIKIDDMESNVFESLLHFIYTDSLPVTTDVVMAGHLLVAADRYNIERLKLMCEDKLCNNMDANMAATSLALAEQHGCHGLKEACFDFLASPSNLEAMKASDGYEHLKNSCPSVLKELLARLLPVELQAAKDIMMDI